MKRAEFFEILSNEFTLFSLINFSSLAATNLAQLGSFQVGFKFSEIDMKDCCPPYRPLCLRVIV